MKFEVSECALRLAPVQTFGEASAIVLSECAGFPPIRSAAIFGSFARDEQADGSDLDLLASVDECSYVEFCKFGYSLAAALGRDVDIVTSMAGASRSFRESIGREGVLVYERENIRLAR